MGGLPGVAPGAGCRVPLLLLIVWTTAAAMTARWTFRGPHTDATPGTYPFPIPDTNAPVARAA